MLKHTRSIPLCAVVTRIRSLTLTCLIALSPTAIQATEHNLKEAESDWGDWQQTLMDVDVYTLPLSRQQHEILQAKITKLKQKFGVGITDKIEQTINQMDNSNLLDEPLMSSPLDDREQSQSTTQSLVRDDLMLEEEILALEFADSMKAQDPEGLTRQATDNQVLFNKIMQQLEQLEQNALKQKVKHND